MRRILILKINGIGDVIMSLAMLDQIYKEEPKTKVTWITGRAGAKILERFSVHKIIIVDEKAILYGSLISKICAVSSVWRQLCGQTYDTVFIPYRDIRYRIMVFPIRCADIRMFGKDKRGRMIPIPGRKFIDEYRRFVHGEDEASREAVPSIVMDVSALPDIAKERNLANYVVLSPGGFESLSDNQLAVRQWPIASYVELAEELLTQGYQIVVTGAPSEIWMRKWFLRLPIHDLIGEIDLMELIRLYHDAEVVVTHDSGSLHLAGLAGARLLGLFGPTDPNVFMPRSLRAEYIWEQSKYACCPCYDGVKMAKCENNHCMGEISVHQVLENMKRMQSMR